MKEKSEEASLVGVVLECGRNVLGRHEDHEWHVEVMRHAAESQAVVAVDYDESRTSVHKTLTSTSFQLLLNV